MSGRIRFIAAIVLAALMLVSAAAFAGCNTGSIDSDQVPAAENEDSNGEESVSGDQVDGEETAEKEEAAEEAGESPFEIIDGEGTVLQFDKPAKNIIVLAPSVLEILDGLEAMDLVAEIDSFTVMAEEPLAEGFKGVGDYQSLNVERIAEINPEVIFAITGGPDEDYLKVKDLGIKIYRVIDVKGFDGVYREIANVSKIAGLEEDGVKMTDELRADVEEIQDKTKDLTDDQRPKVFYEIWNDPLMSSGGDTFVNDLIEIGGGINILAEDGVTGWAEYSVETLVEKNPRIIIAPISLAADASVIKNDQRFSSIDAVINDRIYIVPDNPVSRPSQNIIKGLEMFARAIHPEIFGEFKVIE